MGNQSSTIANKSVSEIVNKSINSTSNSSEIKSDSQSFQNATVNIINKSSGSCIPAIEVDIDQQATIASMTNNQSTVSQDATTAIMNKAEQLAEQGSVQTQEGLFKLSNQNSKQLNEQIQNQRNDIENIVNNSMKSMLSQSSTQEGVINFTNEAHYECYKDQNPNEVPPIKLGIKQVADLIAKQSASGITESLAKTDLKNLTIQESEQKNDQSSTGLFASLGKSAMIIIGIIAGICLLVCVAMLFLGPSTEELTNSATTLANTGSI